MRAFTGFEQIRSVSAVGKERLWPGSGDGLPGQVYRQYSQVIGVSGNPAFLKFSGKRAAIRRAPRGSEILNSASTSVSWIRSPFQRLERGLVRVRVASLPSAECGFDLIGVGGLGEIVTGAEFDRPRPPWQGFRQPVSTTMRNFSSVSVASPRPSGPSRRLLEGRLTGKTAARLQRIGCSIPETSTS